MTECYQTEWAFPACKNRKVQVDFRGGDVTSDAGLLLLRQVDRRLGLTRQISRVIPENRRKRSSHYTQQALLRQRVLGIAQGYEDLNDHDTLRDDPLFQTAVDQTDRLSSSSTLCRWENRMDRQAAWKMHEVLVDQFIASHRSRPKELVLDIDATDDRVHGQQQGRFFHGYYDHYCFLPLYVFCGDQLLVSYLRPSNIDGARHSWAVLSLLIKRLRQKWPKVRIIVRGDSGFCRWKMLRWFERNSVKYVIGLARNDRVWKAAEHLHELAADDYELTGEKQTCFGWVEYGALSWDRKRRVIAKAEHGPQGTNPRYVVSNLQGSAERIYRKVYCARGEMENRIMEQQLHLFSDRTSCHGWWANQFRLLLSSVAYVLVERLRAIGLKATSLARAHVQTIRLKFLKIGAVITRNTRRVRVHCSSAYPDQALFALVAKRLAIE